jgi:hypothetical protein
MIQPRNTVRRPSKIVSPSSGLKGWRKAYASSGGTSKNSTARTRFAAAWLIDFTLGETMRVEEITVERIDIEPPGAHADLSTYETVVFRVLPADHPNSFTVPISVNLSRVSAHEAQAHARKVFHHLMRSLGQATATWNIGDHGDAAAIAASTSDALLGPAGDPAEGKR